MDDTAPARSGDDDSDAPVAESSAPQHGGLNESQMKERVLGYDEPSYGFVKMAVVGLYIYIY